MEKLHHTTEQAHKLLFAYFASKIIQIFENNAASRLRKLSIGLDHSRWASMNEIEYLFTCAKDR